MRNYVSKILIAILLVTSVTLFAAGKAEKKGTTKAVSGPKVTLEVISRQPEYINQEKAVWAIYEKSHPNVKIKLISINEGQESTISTRIAAGNPPHIADRTALPVGPTTYKAYVNLLTVDAKAMKNLTFDVHKLYKDLYGWDNYVPALPIFEGIDFTLLWYKDVMDSAGLNPKSIKTWSDMDSFLAKLKGYVDTDPKLSIVWDYGWHPWVFGQAMLGSWAVSLGAHYSDLQNLFLGKISWTDLKKNPYVPVFKKLHQYYKKGYFPKQWWTRAWENDFEAGLIAGKSAFAWHGPWIWTKILAQKPNAKLDGTTLPAGPGNTLAMYPMDGVDGYAMFSAWQKDKKLFPIILDAFNWVTSTPIAEKVSQYVGSVPHLKNLSPDYELDNPQYQHVMKEAFKIYNVSYKPFGWTMAIKYQIKGRAIPTAEDVVAGWVGKYLEDKISLKDLMKYFENKWKAAYKLPNK